MEPIHITVKDCKESIKLACKILEKNGIENFLQRHEKKLSEASTLGKMWVAVSVLLAHFCLQACANNWVWNKTAKIVALILGLECPNLILGLNLLILLKMCDLLKDLTSAQFNINALSLIS